MFRDTSIEMSVLCNGEITSAFQPPGALQQGDPLSLYLFVLSLQKFTTLIDIAVDNGSWKPLFLSIQGLAISEVFFVDDLILFGKATMNQCEIMIDRLNKFCSF